MSFLVNLEVLADHYLTREETGRGYFCNICNRRFRDKYAAKDHLEGKHFPTDGGYSCAWCGKVANTKNAINCHMKTCPKTLK